MGDVLETHAAREGEIHGPEAYGDAVAAHEAVLVGGKPEETALAGDRLIQPAKVQQRIGAEAVALREERPDVADPRRTGRGLAWPGGTLAEERLIKGEGAHRPAVLRPAGHGQERRMEIVGLLALAPGDLGEDGWSPGEDQQSRESPLHQGGHEITLICSRGVGKFQTGTRSYPGRQLSQIGFTPCGILWGEKRSLRTGSHYNPQLSSGFALLATAGSETDVDRLAGF